MTQRQFTKPLLIQGDQAIQLHRISLSEKSFSEDWLQKLLFDHPNLIPVGEIEPIFEGLISIARELPTRAGPLDLFYVNARGFLTLAETKLWRNPEARRSVVAQIIDYAKEMARWTYGDLVEAVRRTGATGEPDPLVEKVRKFSDDLDEAAFVDTVSRNSRRGRFLLLIIGDGIREDVEHMVEFLQGTPQLGFTLGLIEIGLHRVRPDQTEPIFVQPRILARTQEVTRAIVTINTPLNPADVQVTLPPPGEEVKERHKITEEEFFRQLQAVGPEAVELVRWVLDNAENHSIQINWGEAGPLLQFESGAEGHVFTFGQLSRKGVFAQTGRLFQQCQALGLPVDISRAYLDKIVKLIPGAFREASESQEKIEVPKTTPGAVKRNPPLALLAPHREEWLKAIDETKEAIRKHLGE